MNEIMAAGGTGVISTAQQLHAKIITNVALIGQAYVDMTKGLKQMRDEKLYAELGYADFDTYVEDNFPFKARQAYTYISTLETLGESFLQSNANLGVTKLELLKGLFCGDRQALLEENDVEGMTVKELREQVAKLQEKGEQLSMFQEKAEELEDENEVLLRAKREQQSGIEKLNRIINDLQEKLDEQQEEMERLQAEPVDVAVQELDAAAMEEIRAAARAEAEAEAKAKISSEKEQIRKAAHAEAVEAAEKRIAAERKRAEEKLNREREELESQKQKAEQALQEAQEAHRRELEKIAKEHAEAEQAMQKKAAISANPDTATFKLYFEELQIAVKRVLECISKTEDATTADKLRTAAKKYLDMVREDIEV